jgi:hypothetical protein
VVLGRAALGDLGRCANADKLIARSVEPGKLKFNSDDPGIGRGSHPGEWVRYRSI